MSDTARKMRIRWIVFLSTLFLLVLLCNSLASFLGQDATDRALAQAVAEEDIAGVRLALRRGANPNIDYEVLQPLWWRLGHPAYRREGPYIPVLVYAIVPDKIPLSDPDSTVVRLLLEAGANPNGTTDNGATPLMTAAGWGVKNHVRLLLASGARVNARDNWGHTALHWARTPVKMTGPKKKVLELRKKEVTELLMQAGAKE